MISNSRSGLTGALLAACMALSAPAGAQTYARVDAGSMSCSALQNVIRQSGAVTVYSIERDPYVNVAERLVTGRRFRDGFSVERYVSHRGYCLFNEVIRPRTVTTQDTEFCPVKLCDEPERNGRRN